MKNCKQFQELIIDDFYNQINQEAKLELAHHLEKCENCQSQFSQINSTLKTVNNYERPEPGREFWENYWLKLEPKLIHQKSLLERIYSFFSRLSAHRSWIYGIATSAAFLIIGIFIGKSIFGPDTTTPIFENQTNQKNIQTVATAERYLERSKVLLLGIVNMDSDSNSAYKPSILKQQKISRELIQQTAVLKEDLQNANKRRLLDLVKELEVILLQIANLEKEYDLDAIQLIQSSLDRKGILIKINLEEILSVSDVKNKVSTPKDKKQI